MPIARPLCMWRSGQGVRQDGAGRAPAPRSSAPPAGARPVQPRLSGSAVFRYWDASMGNDSGTAREATPGDVFRSACANASSARRFARRVSQSATRRGCRSERGRECRMSILPREVPKARESRLPASRQRGKVIVAAVTNVDVALWSGVAGTAVSGRIAPKAGARAGEMRRKRLARPLLHVIRPPMKRSPRGR